MKRAILVILLLSFLACSPRKQLPIIESTGQYEVRVYRGSEEVKDFQDQLVHRIELNSSQLNRFLGPNGELKELPFASRIEYDTSGRVWGLRVFDNRQSGGTIVLGFHDRDVITAVGRKLVRNKTDLADLFRTLRSEKHATLTLDRAGRPHKILYYYNG